MVAPLQLTMKCTCCKKKTKNSKHFWMTNWPFKVPVVMLVITTIKLSKDLTKLSIGSVPLNLKAKDRTGKRYCYRKFWPRWLWPFPSPHNCVIAGHSPASYGQSTIVVDYFLFFEYLVICLVWFLRHGLIISSIYNLHLVYLTVIPRARVGYPTSASWIIVLIKTPPKYRKPD